MSVFKNGLVEVSEKYKDLFNLAEQVDDKITFNWEESAVKCGIAKNEIKDYFNSYSEGNRSLATYTQYLKDQNKVIDLQTIKTKALNVVKNIGINLGIAAASALVFKGIQAIITSIDDYVHRLEYAVDAMEEANSSFESLDDEVASLNDELETCRDRIKELQALSDAGTISITEQEELDRLKEENAELERNLRLQQEKARLAAIEAADAATSTLTTSVESQYKTTRTTAYVSGVYSGYEFEGSAYVTPTEELHEAIEAYYELENAVNDLKESYDANEISSEEYEKQLASLTDQQIEARTRMSEMYDIVDEGSTSYKNLTDYGIELDKEQQELYQSAIDVSNEYDDLIKTLDKTTTATDILAESQEDLSNTSTSISDIFALEDAESTATALGELNDQLDTIQSAYKSLSDAMETYNDTGYITIDQLQSIIEQGGQFLDYLVDENGNLSMDEQAMYNLAAARLYEMKCKVRSNIIDTVTAIQDEDAAATYLTSTNYELADSYTALTTAKLAAWKADMLSSGNISGSTVNTVYDKAVADIQKVKDLFSKVNITSLGSAATATSSSGSGSSSSTETDYKNLLDDEIDLLEAQLDAGYISFKEYIKKRRNLIEDYYAKGLISAEDYYSELESMYQKQIDIYDQVLQAVSDRYDEEIDKIQEVIDGIEDQNDALVYTENDGYVFMQDEDAVKEAQQSLTDLELDQIISELEKEQDAIQATIDGLQDMADAWGEVSDAYDNAKAVADAINFFGDDYVDIVLNSNQSDIVILSRLVDTFSSRILHPMLLLSGKHRIAVV